ncbi:MAG: hypothetical protein WCF84_25025 [Anaerolineae bacterium]
MPHELIHVANLYNTDYLTAGPDILVASPAPGYKDTAESARASMDYVQNYARQLGKKCGVVVVMNNILSQDAETRRIYSERSTPDLFYGTAMVAGNPLARAVVSFFLGLSKLPIPLRMVDSIDSGIAWLETIKGE